MPNWLPGANAIVSTLSFIHSPRLMETDSPVNNVEFVPRLMQDFCKLKVHITAWRERPALIPIKPGGHLYEDGGWLAILEEYLITKALVKAMNDRCTCIVCDHCNFLRFRS